MDSSLSNFPKSPAHLLLVAVLLGGGLYVLGQYVASLPSQAENRVEANRELTVQGRGEVQGKPDVARLSIGIQTGVQPTAKAALDILSRRADAILKAAKEQVKDEADMKVTNLTIIPQYDYPEGRTVLRGFEASETIELKIRDLGAIGTVIARATDAGANTVGGISFEIDDPKALEEEAKEQAIEDAQQNAEKLARKLSIKLGRIKSFTAMTSGKDDRRFEAIPLAAGGAAPGVVPPTPSGSQEIIVNVNITYELR